MSIVTSVLTGGINSHTTSSEEANGISTDFVSEGVVGTITNTSGSAPATGGFAVNAQGTPDNTVAVSSGIAYVTGTPTSQNSQTFRVRNSATANVTIAANSSGSTKYDWVYIKLDATKLNAPNAAGDDAATLVTSRSSSITTDDGTPPTYGLLLAIVAVANGFTTITNGNIKDVRTNATVSATSNGTSQDWYSTGVTPASVTYNGNRSYTLVVNTTDLTSYISPGMRLRTTRTVTAPTQCTSLNGTNQYWSKSSPSAMTFTDDFVVSAWIKVSSYATSNLVSRYNGTSGWGLQLNSSGQVLLFGTNAGAANYSQVLSYQSIPLNRWVHVAAQLDMSTFTATTTTSYVMIDGLDVPAVVSRGGTNPTALIQAGNLEIGSANSGTNPFPGKIAQVAIYNAKVTQATIRGSISQSLSGSETSLISAYSFNNTSNDLSANANNLSANNSAAATNSDSPFSLNGFGTATGTSDYAVVQTASYSTNTTIVVQVAEGNTIPTSGGVSALSYSTMSAPYGMPVSRRQWTLEMIAYARQSASPSASTWVNLGHQITAPIGEWRATISGNAIVSHSGATFLNWWTTLSTSSSSATDKTFNTSGPIVSTSTTEQDGGYFKEGHLSLSAQTVYYLNALTTTSSTTLYLGDASAVNVPTMIRLENAYIVR